MNSKKNFIIAILALTTVVSGIFAWQQFQRARGNAATTSSNNDALLKKLADAERHAADLEARLAALQSTPSGEASAVPPEIASAPAERRGDDRNGANNRRAEMQALMDNPEVQKLMVAQQRAGLDARYATLFKQLNLPPAQLEKLKNLLLEKQNAQRDVMSAARDSGLNPRESRDELRKLVQDTNAETDAAISAAIGQEKFAQYQNYETTGVQRALVEQLNRTMEYSATPLTDAQSQALVQILAQSSQSGTTGNNAPRGGFNGGGGFAGAPFGGMGNRTTITDAMITQAQNVLSAAQVKVLQEQQAVQQNEQKLRQLLRPPGQGNNRSRE